MSQVPCLTTTGALVMVPADEVTFGVAVYGILVENERVLLRRHPETGLWEPPGGRLFGRQAPEQGVRSLFRAQTGLVCDPVLRLLLESQHRLDEQGQAWELTVITYQLQRTRGSTITAPAGGGEQPLWIPLDELQREQMQTGYDAIQIARRETPGGFLFPAVE